MDNYNCVETFYLVMTFIPGIPWFITALVKTDVSNLSFIAL